MCGFVAILKVKGDTRQAREKALKMSRKIRHRGPDWSGVYSSEKAVLAHERLAIVDPLSGGQPLYSSDGKKVLAVNDDEAIRLGQIKASDNESGGIERIDPVTTSQKLGAKVIKKFQEAKKYY